MKIKTIAKTVGASTLFTVRSMGQMFVFLSDVVRLLFVPPFKFRRFLKQVRFIGAKSMSVIVLTGAFTGMVLTLQLFYTLRKFGSEALLGPAIALSLIRELGPVLAALMITGRAGSAITAEIGIMRISGADRRHDFHGAQSPALPSRAQYCGFHCRIPLLAAIFDVVGIYGGYAVAVKLLGMSQGTYFSQMEKLILMEDICVGLYKSLSFGIIVSWVCCFKGFTTEETGYGAEGVSKSTTEAVVMSSVLILIWDYLLGSFFLQT